MNEQREEMCELEPLVLQHKDIKKKMKKSTKIILVITILVLISLVVLFVVKKILPAIERNQNMKVYKQEGYIEQDVMKYLEERYGEEFVIESIRGRSYAYDYINMYAYPKEHQEESYQFKIQGRYNEKGILEYTDSYVMLKLRDEYEAYIDPVIDEYFDEYKFYMDFDSEWITSNIPADAKLEDLWELDANVDYPLPAINLFIKSINGEEKKELKNMVSELSTTHVRCVGYVAHINSEEKYESLINDWNSNVDGLDYEKDISTFIIYDNNNFKIRIGGKKNGIK